MQDQIPIIVTRKLKPTRTQLLKTLFRPKINSNVTPQQIKDSNVHSPSYQTLQTYCNKENITRVRRISSSGASKRFPKDFFRDQNCLLPTKANKSKTNLNPVLGETFNKHKVQTFKFAPDQNDFIFEAQECIDHFGEEKSDTPKFISKAENIKSQVREGKIKLYEYLSHKKAENNEGNIFSDYQSNFEKEKRKPIAQVVEDNQKQNEFDMKIPFISNFNLTLGKPSQLAFLLRNQDKQKDIDSKLKCKYEEIEEKQNRGEGMKRESKSQLKQKHTPRRDEFRIRKHILN